MPRLKFSLASLLLCAVVLSLTGCKRATDGTAEISPQPSIPVTPVEEPLSATSMLTADQLREQLGANDQARFERTGRDFTAISLVGSGAKTLEPLKGQPIKFLDISGTEITDLSPLKGMPLEQFMLIDTPVEDLSPIAGAPIRTLDASQSQVANLAPVATLGRLAELYLEKAQVEDITPLKDLSLTKLWINYCPVKDFTPLAGKSLEELNLCNTPITDLKVIGSMQLGTLWLRETAVKDLSPIGKLSLVSLDIQGSQVTDLSPLAKMTSLERLNISKCSITDLTPLKGLTLTRLIFSPEKITKGIDVIRGMASLRGLDTSFDGTATAMTPAEFWERYDAGGYRPEKPPE